MALSEAVRYLRAHPLPDVHGSSTRSFPDASRRSRSRPPADRGPRWRCRRHRGPSARCRWASPSTVPSPTSRALSSSRPSGTSSPARTPVDYPTSTARSLDNLESGVTSSTALSAMREWWPLGALHPAKVTHVEPRQVEAGYAEPRRIVEDLVLGRLRAEGRLPYGLVQGRVGELDGPLAEIPPIYRRALRLAGGHERRDRPDPCDRSPPPSRGHGAAPLSSGSSLTGPPSDASTTLTVARKSSSASPIAAASA